MWWPVIGGLFIGIGGLIEPRILGVGYDVIRDLLNGQIIGMALLTLLVVKALAWAIALGSGTSGGVLAPLIIMGGALGAIEAHWIPAGDTSLWVMLSMAAMMGGTMRAPLTAMVFTLELTHDLNVLPGLLVACIAAHGVTVLLLRRSILTEKVARHGHHLIREYSVDPLEIVRVGEIMDRQVPTLPATMTVTELSEQIARGNTPLTRRQGTPIVDQEGDVVGILTRTDLLRALEDNPDSDRTVLEAGSRDLIVAYPDESLGTAVARMLKNDIGRLVVVSRQDPHRLLGYIGRSGVLTARLLRFQEEQAREPGWFARRLSSEISDQPT
jgi:CBS domain-containing protein